MEPRHLAPPAPSVIYEDRDLVVVNKPAGLQVHAVRGKEWRATLVDWLVKKFPQIKTVGDDPTLRPGIVHRLDKDTSGIMVVAKTQSAFDHLKLLFQRHEMKKTYLAIVLGVPKEKRGVVDAPIGIRSGTLKRSTRSAKMAKAAVTEYRVVRTLTVAGRQFALLELTPRTGRTHQIRVHLASIGHPVAGDRLYGPKAQPPWAGRLMLHALSLEFTAPAGGKMKFEAEPPEGFRKVIHI